MYRVHILSIEKLKNLKPVILKQYAFQDILGIFT